MRKGDRIFVDGLSTVKMVDGVIVMEFFNNRKSTSGAEVEESCGEVVMGQRGFLRAYQAMEDLINQMEKAGIVQRKNSAKPNDKPVIQDSISPNFQ